MIVWFAITFIACVAVVLMVVIAVSVLIWDFGRRVQGEYDHLLVFWVIFNH